MFSNKKKQKEQNNLKKRIGALKCGDLRRLALLACPLFFLIKYAINGMP